MNFYKLLNFLRYLLYLKNLFLENIPQFNGNQYIINHQHCLITQFFWQTDHIYC